jgi:hypothetical protein
MKSENRTPNNPDIIKRIKSSIKLHVKKSMGTDNPRLSLWYCGITNDIDRRKSEHKLKKGNIAFWKYFDAETMNDAQIIETDMSILGMSNATNKGRAHKGSKNVYVFKLPSSLSGFTSIDDFLNQLFS